MLLTVVLTYQQYYVQHAVSRIQKRQNVIKRALGILITARCAGLIKSVKLQIEHFFDPNNFAASLYELSDPDGFVPLAVVATFSSLSSLFTVPPSTQSLAACLTSSTVVELSDDGSGVRSTLKISRCESIAYPERPGTHVVIHTVLWFHLLHGLIKKPCGTVAL